MNRIFLILKFVFALGTSAVSSVKEPCIVPKRDGWRAIIQDNPPVYLLYIVMSVVRMVQFMVYFQMFISVYSAGDMTCDIE